MTTMRELFQAHTVSMSAEGCSPKTIRHYNRTLLRYGLPVLDIPIATITVEHLQAIKNQKWTQDSPRHKATTTRDGQGNLIHTFNLLNLLWRKAIHHNIIPESPFPGLEIIKELRDAKKLRAKAARARQREEAA